MCHLSNACENEERSWTLGRLEPSEVGNCLRNIAGMGKRGGYLFVMGIDPNVRVTVARDLRWRAVSKLIDEIHEGNPSLLGDWPFDWWGFQPFDKKRDDWRMRNVAVFRLNRD